MATITYEWIANLKGPMGPAGPSVPAEQLATAVEAALAATGRLSNLGVSVGTGNPLTDLDALPSESGFYRVFSTASNRPPGGFTGSLLHLAYSSTVAVQIAVPVGTNMNTGLWLRVRKADGFEGWQKLPTTADLAAALNDRITGLVAELGLATETTMANTLNARVQGLVAELNLPTVATIAATGGRWADLDLVDAALPVSLDVRSTAAHRPVADGTRWTGWHIPTGDGASQVLVSLSSPPRAYSRVKTGGAWTAWDDTIQGTDPRALKMGDTQSFRIIDGAGKVLGDFDARTGVFTAPDFVARRARIAGGVTIEGDEGIHRVLDSAGKRLFETNAYTGRTFIADLDPESNITGGIAAKPPFARILLEVVAGQSNAAARGLPYGARLDPTNSHIMMAVWEDTVVTGLAPSTVPVSSQAVTATAGFGVGDVIARRIAAEQPDTLVVQLNAAKGGAGLVYDTPNGVWAVDYAGPNRALFPICTAAITKTLALIHAQYPGIPVDVQFVWHQGESDSTTPFQAYYDALKALILALRAHVGDPTAPFVAGGTVPEVSDPVEEANVIAALIALQGDLPYYAFTRGIHNGGGSSAPSGDTVHYHRAGVERLGAAMYEALRRAYINTLTSIPLPTLDVSATWRRSAGVLDLDWVHPFCRATAFTAQYRVDGGAWQTITGRPRELDPVAQVTGLTTGGEIEVRVATTNEVGTSAFTVPVYALTA